MNTAETAVLLVIGTLTLLVFVFFLVLIILEYRKKQVRHITEKLELKHRYESEVLQAQIEVQEQSFKHISEEIHDNIAQMLSLVKLKLYKTAGKTTDEAIKAGIETSNELLGKTLNDLRTLSHILNGGLVSRLPLKDSIEKELAYMRDANEMEAQLTISGKPYDIDDTKKLMLFRIVQESINNAIKHGKAKKINISLAYEDKSLVVRIEDNGVGFDTGLLQESKGLGLHNMQVRAKLLGEVDVKSGPNKGTIITLNVKTNE